MQNRRCKKASSWPVFNGRFKVLVRLEPGENQLEFRFFDEAIVFVLHYRIPEFVNFVRPIYIKCCDDAGRFQGPEDEDLSVESALRRISLTAKLLQTFTAEKMFEHGFERKTFVLENDLDPTQPQCHEFTSQLTLAEAQSKNGGDLWMTFARELMSSKQFKEKTNCKWFAFMSFTRYIPPKDQVPKSHSDVLRFTKGHAALGGGGLALYGSGTLHCWAQNLDEVLTRLTDSRKMDRTRFMDDSAYREFYWANYSTGLGAALHELGHTFDLSHTPTGVMARGFDDIHRMFTVFPLRSGSSGDISHTASPIAYSPKQSPVRKTTMVPAMNGSPKPCYPLRHSHQWSFETPSVVQVETSFRKVHVQTSQTMIMKNYDGSEVAKTVTRHRDGVETVVELTTYPDSKVLLREFVKNLASGKSRTTISMTTCLPPKGSESCNGIKAQHKGKDPPSPPPGSFSICNGNGTDTQPATQFQEARYKDGGAHWYRSSAVLLHYHKWFNIPTSKITEQPTMDGNLIRCPSGLRLIELRTVPDGAVFHHWEFLHNPPPVQFILDPEEIREFAPGIGGEIGLLAEDDAGNILKKKITLSDLECTTT